MYLHIGDNKTIDMSRIVAIFKAHPRKTEKSNPLRQYCKSLIILSKNDPSQRIKCYVVMEDCIYGTPISLATIVKRYRQMEQIMYHEKKNHRINRFCRDNESPSFPSFCLSKQGKI